MRDRKNRAFQFGYRAYKAGACASANPYILDCYYEIAPSWLEGWISAAEEALKTKGEGK